MHVFLATSWLDPIVHGISAVLTALDSVVHNRGWSLILFALIFKVVTWPLNTKQFMAMIKMQQLAPQLKAMQTKYAKSDPQRYQKETMELYKKHGANPFAGCLPLLVQMPIIFSVYWAVIQNKAYYAQQPWLWIGAQFTQHMPKLPIWNAPLLASSLALPDLVLLVLYMASIYLISRYGTMPATDPQQAQTQRLMAYFSPVMLAYVGFRYKWPSAMVLYWLSYNVFTMAQSLYLLRKYHKPLSALDDFHAITELPEEAQTKALANPNGAVGDQNQRRRRNKKKKRARR